MSNLSNLGAYELLTSEETMQETDDAPLLTPAEVQEKLRIGRSTFFTLIRTGELDSTLIGTRCRRVPAAALEDYISRRAGQHR